MSTQNPNPADPAAEFSAHSSAHASTHSAADLSDRQAAELAATLAADAAAQPQGAADIAALQARITELEAQTAEHYDAFLRARAETENIRRRAANEASNASKYAIESFAEALVPVCDSLEAAMADQSGSVDAMRAGVEITLKQLRQALEKNKVLAVEPAGEKFDPNFHMAVQMIPGNSVEPAVASNHVVRVLQKGYRIHERVLRPAMVAVAQ